MEGVERAIASGGLASSGYGTDAESAGSGFGEQVSTKSMAGIQESMSKRAGDGSVTSGGASAEMGSVDDQQSMAGHGSVRWSSKGSMVTAGMAMQLGSTGLEGDSLKRVVSGDDCSGNASGARVASPLTSRGAASSFSVPFGQSQQPRTPPGLAAASMAGSLPGTGIFNGPAGPHAAMRSGPADKQGCASREHQQPRPIFTAMAFNPSPSSSSVPLQSFGLYSAADGLASGAANESGHAPQLSVFANPAPSPPVRSSAEPTCPYVRSASSAEISDARSAAPTVMMTSSPVSPPAYKSLASTAQPLIRNSTIESASRPTQHAPTRLPAAAQVSCEFSVDTAHSPLTMMTATPTSTLAKAASGPAPADSGLIASTAANTASSSSAEVLAFASPTVSAPLTSNASPAAGMAGRDAGSALSPPTPTPTTTTIAATTTATGVVASVKTAGIAATASASAISSHDAFGAYAAGVRDDLAMPSLTSAGFGRVADGRATELGFGKHLAAVSFGNGQPGHNTVEVPAIPAPSTSASAADCSQASSAAAFAWSSPETTSTATATASESASASTATVPPVSAETSSIKPTIAAARPLTVSTVPATAESTATPSTPPGLPSLVSPSTAGAMSAALPSPATATAVNSTARESVLEHETDIATGYVIPQRHHFARASEPDALPDLGDSTATLYSSASHMAECAVEQTLPMSLAVGHLNRQAQALQSSTDPTAATDEAHAEYMSSAFHADLVTSCDPSRVDKAAGVVFFQDGLSLLIECAVAAMENRKPKMGVVIPAPGQIIVNRMTTATTGAPRPTGKVSKKRGGSAADKKANSRQTHSQQADALLSAAASMLDDAEDLGDGLASHQTNISDTSVSGTPSVLLGGTNGATPRHGISRYAPYGSRFAAKMRDGSLRTSHVAGDLANRARMRNGRGARVDLILITHDGEMEQLETAWHFCEAALARGAAGRPGPSDVLNHLRDIGIDHDYRKTDGTRLLQRNASNFYKRMMEYGRKLEAGLETSSGIRVASLGGSGIGSPSISAGGHHDDQDAMTGVVATTAQANQQSQEQQQQQKQQPQYTQSASAAQLVAAIAAASAEVSAAEQAAAAEAASIAAAAATAVCAPLVAASPATSAVAVSPLATSVTAAVRPHHNTPGSSSKTATPSGKRSLASSQHLHPNYTPRRASSGSASAHPAGAEGGFESAASATTTPLLSVAATPLNQTPAIVQTHAAAEVASQVAVHQQQYTASPTDGYFNNAPHSPQEDDAAGSDYDPLWDEDEDEDDLHDDDENDKDYNDRDARSTARRSHKSSSVFPYSLSQQQRSVGSKQTSVVSMSGSASTAVNATTSSSSSSSVSFVGAHGPNHGGLVSTGSTGGSADKSAAASYRPARTLSSRGVSRHSPYGTRFMAQMEDGTFRESFLAGDLVDRVRSRGSASNQHDAAHCSSNPASSKTRGELKLVLHPGEVEQLETAWAFITAYEMSTIAHGIRRPPPGAAAVLDHLRSRGLDINYRKQNVPLLQKNAGNLYKRVQEFGRRRTADPSYLRVDDHGAAVSALYDDHHPYDEDESMDMDVDHTGAADMDIVQEPIAAPGLMIQQQRPMMVQPAL